ncbi:uncharacterized protein LOC125039735 [Penaeus chinensis]|uniref:uncharacterized protein LOC125039735 n=1 Tax=Penaeus chinensis TaxID=139456 RepID=UPI001FB766FD|nr:uncharacterized protein LOC125039735 [Penaeus chinensis]
MKKQVLLLAVLLAHAAAGLGYTAVSSVLENSACDHESVENFIDCSAVQDVSEVVDAMKTLSEAGFLDFAGFSLNNNPNVNSLPVDLLGDMKFQRVVITNNINLVSAEDFLGASRDVVTQIDLSSSQLAYVPPLKSSSVTEYTQNAAALELISKDAIAGMPNLQVLKLQGVGNNQQGLAIDFGAFATLKKLEVLDLEGSRLRGSNVTSGAFQFDSPALKTVQLGGIYMENVFPGSFEGFTANTTLTLMLNYPITIGNFFNVFNSGAQVVVQETTPCQCNLAWIRLSSFLHQASIRCVVRQDFVSLANVPETYFLNCCSA